MSNDSLPPKDKTETEPEERDVPSDEQMHMMMHLYQENKMLRASNKAIFQVNRLLILVIFIFLITGLIGSWVQS